ncbi:PilZ domain-containing protein [Desulfopila aestuarii]|uniref:PilZ domain-containing protein n=1 Tax=Desulfopila aestuarii DSM 18488 TaxID=1121416 RepID=A0A1M7XWC8_9BACT|nr:PilZ domain-containing protein [Desulfopila aestuarii]SHO43045.1 PilZ domain-containing protein [Desulfopila aestuarii DSM 18488]
MANEKRIQQRFTLNLQAKMTYSFDDSSNGEYISTVAANISCGGAFLETDQQLPLASRVNLEFLLAIEDLKKLKVVASVDILRKLAKGKQVWVQATGVVIRQEPNGVAVIFDQNYQLSPMQPGSE